MSAARGNSSSTRSTPPGMHDKEACIVLAHSYQAENDEQHPYTGAVASAPKWEDAGRCSRQHFDS